MGRVGFDQLLRPCQLDYACDEDCVLHGNRRRNTLAHKCNYLPSREAPRRKPFRSWRVGPGREWKRKAASTDEAREMDEGGPNPVHRCIVYRGPQMKSRASWGAVWPCTTPAANCNPRSTRHYVGISPRFLKYAFRISIHPRPLLNGQHPEHPKPAKYHDDPRRTRGFEVTSASSPSQGPEKKWARFGSAAHRNQKCSGGWAEPRNQNTGVSTLASQMGKVARQGRLPRCRRTGNEGT